MVEIPSFAILVMLSQIRENLEFPYFSPHYNETPEVHTKKSKTTVTSEHFKWSWQFGESVWPGV